MFLLFDPIYYINKTLSTFDRMVAKLEKYLEKCDVEISKNLEIQKNLLEMTAKTIDDVHARKEQEMDKIETKALAKIKAINETSFNATSALDFRNARLRHAIDRAQTTVNNIKQITGGV